jgi:hypothetical protein
MDILRICTLAVKREVPWQGLFSNFHWLAFACPMERIIRWPLVGGVFRSSAHAQDFCKYDNLIHKRDSAPFSENFNRYSAPRPSH